MPLNSTKLEDSFVKCLSKVPFSNLLIFVLDFMRLLDEWEVDQWKWMGTFEVDRLIYKVILYQQDQPDPRPESALICRGCSRDWDRIALYSHTRRCSPTNPHGAIP